MHQLVVIGSKSLSRNEDAPHHKSDVEGGGNYWQLKTLGRSMLAWNLTTAWAKTRGS